MPAPGQLGPHSRLIDRGSVSDFIDGRSRQGKFLRHYEAMLTEHVGGKPSLVQRALIQRAARMALHLELMDEKALRHGHRFGPYDHNYYIAWSNGLARLLARLGLQPPPPPQPSLADVLRDIEAQRQSEAMA